jgi:hypothetical protein
MSAGRFLTMISLPDFKTNVLAPLLRGEYPTKDVPLTLFAAELDYPLHYIFESNRWGEVSGASRRLASAGDKMRAILAKDGYGPDDMLHADGGSVFALVHDRPLAERWAEAVERAIALETDLVTVSTLIHPVTAQQLRNGLYGTPRSVIGVPGVNDYQERINRYYGLDSPSTVPREDLIAQRHHFAEVVALMHSLLIRARESRQVVPFYEALPFAVRCSSCRVRPAERSSDGPICGVCLRKRNEARAAQPERPALVWLEAAGLDRLLEQQRTVAAYRRVYREISEVLNMAIPNRATLLAASSGWTILALPGDEALDTATGALEAIALHYNLKPPTPFVAAVAMGTGPEPFRALFDLANRTALNLRRTIDAAACLLDVRVLDRPFDRYRSPYTVDEARRLSAGVAALREARLREEAWPAFADLPEQAARGNAGLYYTFERSKLPAAAQDALKRLERLWEIGPAPGPRFYAMLSDALALARLVD